MSAEYLYVGGDLEAVVKSSIRDVPDFPKPGIVFKDIAPVLADAKLFKKVVDFYVERYRGKSIDTVVGVESRGFIFGAPVAYELGVSFHMARKKGKLPYSTVEKTYDLEYGSATIEMHSDAIKNGERVLIVDDLLATGGTVSAVAHLIERLGGKVAECAFLIELDFLQGRDVLSDYNICTLVRYD